MFLKEKFTKKSVLLVFVASLIVSAFQINLIKEALFHPSTATLDVGLMLFLVFLMNIVAITLIALLLDYLVEKTLNRLFNKDKHKD